MFWRLIAMHSAALGEAAGAGGQLRVTPELTRGLLRVVTADAFNVGGGGGDAGRSGGVAGGGLVGGGAGGVPPGTPPAVSKLRGAVQGVEFETPLISDGADGLCTRHRVSPYQIEAAGRPLAALPQDPYALIAGDAVNDALKRKFVEVEVGGPKPGTAY